MSQDERRKMVATGMVQEGGGGVTYAVEPATSEAYWWEAAPGTGYVEFDVPSDSLYPGGKPGWVKMSTPRGLPGRVAFVKGLPTPELPPASNISEWKGPK